MPQFIVIEDDGERITSKMPPDETVVAVRLKDGSIARAFFSKDLTEPGDWDFIPVALDGKPIMDADSIADQVVAWRPQFDEGEIRAIRKMLPEYTVEITYSDEDEGYIATVSMMEGCSAFGSTREEAAREIGPAMEAWMLAFEAANAA